MHHMIRVCFTHIVQKEEKDNLKFSMNNQQSILFIKLC